MPKVTDQYLVSRREEILQAARRCFVRNGFHATSMQDLFAESGLSAGAVYRYFKSKDEMILAIASDNLREVVDAIGMVSDEQGGSIGEVLSAMVNVFESKDEAVTGGLVVQVWAEALRNPELAAEFTRLFVRTTGALTRLVRAEQRAGRMPDGVPAKAVASLLAGVLPGYVLQRALLGPAAVRGVPAALRALWPPP